MVLRIFNMIATSGFLTALECIKFVFGRASAPPRTLLGELSTLPIPSSWFKGAYFKKGGEWKEEEKGRGMGEERKGRDRPPLRKFLDLSLDIGYRLTI